MPNHITKHPKCKTFYLDKLRLSGWLLGILCFNSLVFAQVSNHTDWYAQYSFIVPNGFIVRPNIIPNVATLMFKQDTFYPSFNVVVQAGAYRISTLTDQEHLSKIESDYNTAGISNLSFFKTTRWNSNGLRMFEALIAYSSKERTLKSSVVLVGGIKRHYVLTWIDLDENFEKHAHLRRRVLESFTSWSDSGRTENKLEDPKTFGNLRNWAISLASLILTGLLIIISRLKPIRKSES